MARKAADGGHDSDRVIEVRRGRHPGDVILKMRHVVRLRRALGVPGLFGVAYGNVASSIYYALGVVAMSALGLTPPVLLLSGILFL